MKKLERSLTLPYVVAIGIGGMLGSGIFVLPGIAAAKTGPSIWLAYLLAGICVLPAALSKAELATAMPTSGGTYVFIERTFGPVFGTISGLGLWLSLLLKSSFALVGFGAYLLVLADFPVKIVALISLVAIMLLNILGIKKVGKVQLVIVIISVLGLIVILIFGLPEVDPANMKPAFTHGNTGLLMAMAFVFVSYAGVTKIAAIAEEIKNPNRNLPIAMLLALFVVTTIYVLVTFTLVGNIPVEDLKEDIHPIYTLSSHLGGRIAGIAAAILGVITLISMANSGVLASSRFPFAMSRDKLLPGLMSRIHPRFLTPAITIVLTCVVMALVIIFLDVEGIAKLASAFKVMMFISVNACVIVLRETAVQWYTPSYRAPFYPFIQIFGILSGMLLMAYFGLFALLVIFVISALGVLLYYLYGRKNSQRSGVLALYGHRPALLLWNRRKRTSGKTVSDKWLPDRIESSILDDSLVHDASVVVPLFGQEISPEMLVEIGAGLTRKKRLQVVHITEVPDQTVLDAMLDDDVNTTSLNRRLDALAEDRELDINFVAAVTHELVDTIHSISDQTHCQWMVIGWHGRAGEGFLIRNPIGWLVTHINCNLVLFKDKGVRYIRKVLVCLHPDRHDPSILFVADKIAFFYNAELTFLRVVALKASPDYMHGVKEESEIFLKSCKSNVHIVIENNDHSVKAISKASAAHDLMIIGNPKGEDFTQILFGKVKDKFADSAACSVMRVIINQNSDI